MDIDKNRNGRVNPGEFFDGENGVEDRRARTTVFLRRFDRHQAELEALLDQIAVEF